MRRCLTVDCNHSPRYCSLACAIETEGGGDFTITVREGSFVERLFRFAPRMFELLKILSGQACVADPETCFTGQGEPTCEVCRAHALVLRIEDPFGLAPGGRRE